MTPTNTEWEKEWDKFLNNDSVYSDSGFGCPECGGGLERVEVESFIRTLLASHDREIRERVEGLRKFHGAKFYGPSEQIWVKAKMISNTVKKEIWNAALDQVKVVLDKNA